MGKPLDPEYHNKYNRDWNSKNALKVLLYTCKHRAKRRGLSFNLTEADVTVPEVCPILGVPLVKGTKYAASIDRIDNSLGYVQGNVQVVSRQANLMKNDASLEELRKFGEWINQLPH